MERVRTLGVVLLLCTGLLIGCTRPAASEVASPCPAFSTTAMPYPDTAMLDAMSCAWQQQGLLIIGERHGTHEIPRVIGDLITRNARRHSIVLAIEQDADQAGVLARYLGTDGQPAGKPDALLAQPEWRDNPGDGRTSGAMFQLLQRVRALRAQGDDVRVILMRPHLSGADAPQDGKALMEALEAGMAETLRRQRLQNPQTRVIALMGSFHARSQMAALPDSVVDRLADLQPHVVSMSGTGMAWNCQGETCGPHPVYDDGPSDGDASKALTIRAEDPGALMMTPLTASAPQVRKTP